MWGLRSMLARERGQQMRATILEALVPFCVREPFSNRAGASTLLRRLHALTLWSLFARIKFSPRLSEMYTESSQRNTR